MKRFNEGGATGDDSSWWDTVGDWGGDIWDWAQGLDSKDLKNLIAGGSGLASLLRLSGVGGDLFEAKQSQPTGYQGSIPKYTATRTRLEQDPNIPAGTGRRYFSDVIFEKQPETQTANAGNNGGAGGDQTQEFARGGVAALAQQGRYLAGDTDGMADKIETTIDGTEEARLSHGEFVIPADVVSHLGNGNSDAGAQVLYDMMDRIRVARTGNKEQGKEINPKQMLPKRGMA